jgi:hypothetical protein
MTIFLVLIVLAVSEIALTRPEKLDEIWKKHKQYSLIFISLIWLYLVYFSQKWGFHGLLFGIGEKQHGLLFPIGLILLWYMLSSLWKKERQYIDITIIFSGVLVSIVAMIEFFGYNIFTWAPYITEWSWWLIRSTSTLGNPNYVAGYLIMLLPIVLSSSLDKMVRYAVCIFLCFGVLTTGSVIGLSIVGVYALYSLWEKYIWRKIYTLFPMILLLFLGGIYGMYSESEKWLSLTSRFILMKHTLLGGFDSILWAILWHGPSGIIEFYSNIRPTEIREYFPDNMTIDSSHNIFIDIFIYYWLIWVSLFIGCILCIWKYLGLKGKSWLILGLSFLSLNVLVISHMILIVYFLTEKKEKH